ncbi:hypothetical protein JOB18_000198 [Solea senegalensis]|uniref:Uncharacterized protein n=1 Tax=Solea senegalensis TaxID=28829 RepID=A0AAV6RWZ3_SOLSE|nr:hypothetical protein JOB18_000198 [Solea senegalensis]
MRKKETTGASCSSERHLFTCDTYADGRFPRRRSSAAAYRGKPTQQLVMCFFEVNLLTVFTSSVGGHGGGRCGTDTDVYCR